MLISKIIPITLKTIYITSQLAPCSCTPEGKGRIFPKERRPSVLLTQSRTHVGPECLMYPVTIPHHYILNKLPLAAETSSATTYSALLHPQPHHQPCHHHEPSTTSPTPLVAISLSPSTSLSLNLLATAAVHCFRTPPPRPRTAIFLYHRPTNRS
jgi:hypothetical protein